eukprot:5225081-Pyramimonas_sp.AAC.1
MGPFPEAPHAKQIAQHAPHSVHCLGPTDLEVRRSSTDGDVVFSTPVEEPAFGDLGEILRLRPVLHEL